MNIEIVIAKTNLSGLILDLEHKASELSGSRKEQAEQWAKLLRVSLDTLILMDEELKARGTRIFAYETEALKLEREIKRLKEIEKNMDI